MTRLFFFCSVRFILLATACPAGAAPIYDNGPPDKKNGFEMTHWIQADDFTLGVGARLEKGKFWSFEGTGSFQGLVIWKIYSNSESNAPGTLLHSGASGILTRVATGFNLFGYAEFVTTFEITPISLPAGVYWFALHNGPLTNNGEEGRVYWATSSNIGSRPSQSLPAPFTDPWFSNAVPPGSPAELAFQLDGVFGPSITAFVFNNGVPRISLTTTAGQNYRVEYRNNLGDASWTPVVGAENISGTGNVLEVSDPDSSARNLTHRFYRARLCPCQDVEGPSLVGFVFDDIPRISFTTIAGQIYRVEYKTDLQNASWTPLPGAETVSGTGDTIQISDNAPNIRALSRRFYRAILLQF